MSSSSINNETKLDEAAADVAYDKGATPLFLAIEQTRWRDAFDIADGSPEQIPIWVRSMGSEGTTFDWALWRRLPIHEVCSKKLFQHRRIHSLGQAPCPLLRAANLHDLNIVLVCFCFWFAGVSTTAPGMVHFAALVQVSGMCFGRDAIWATSTSFGSGEWSGTRGG
jgi:hypothetical protein